MMSFKKSFMFLVSVFLIFTNFANASLFGCSDDRQRCLNSCAERHRSKFFSFASMNLCKGRCLLTECVFYPRKEKKSAHPGDRLQGFAI